MIQPEVLRELAGRHMGEGGLFVYDKAEMKETAQALLDTKMPFGSTVRYAAKANPHMQILTLFDSMGLHFDASSAHEATRILNSSVPGRKISLSSQILNRTLTTMEALKEGVLPVATSLGQISTLAQLEATNIAIRVNPGTGSGHNKRTTVGGPNSSFGIWHEQLPYALAVAKERGMIVDRIHTHIGSGVNPDVWRKTIRRSLTVVKACPDVVTLDIGGGYKIARTAEEKAQGKATDMQQVLGIFADELESFAKRTGREIRLEIEPGTWLVGNAGTLLARIEDIVSTPSSTFLKLNAGMNAILRPSLYGAQHPIEVLNDINDEQDYVIVGPCCESGDILTPADKNPEKILPRRLKRASIGDYVSIGGAGAYCASMCASMYNDVPPATEIMV